MDSLVASYASSDEEDDESLTVKSSHPTESRSSSFLSSIPPPKSSISRQNQNPIPAINKRVVQIRLPINPRPSNLDDEEDDEEEEKTRKKRKQIESATPHDSSVKSFLSAMPAPKSSQALGALPSLGSGSGRRSNLETETPAIATQTVESGSYESISNHSSETEQIAGVENYYGGGYETNPSSASVGYDGSSSYGGNSWNGGGGFEAEAMIAMDSGARRGRRGRKEMPMEIVEVKQDELMKNRPRVDQVKATGLAFGPAYQPATSSKVQVSKLHKRKHQITSLFMDMKHKESELSERRSRGLLTKAETQAKYGW
ncbi:hypothetical protein AALP_AA3G356500 [Arabis alpina]|uniref:Proline-rich protein PRCC n=1 Tax=Arabis alpina TaxID=50452 RepID=A0A087HDU2_ARAAL|nr:hypothetical protein AALP_AA3G356500 [Arabis alpina]